MSIYQVTIEIESDTRVDRLREILDRIVLHTFGSSGTVENFVELDPEADPETWNVSPQIQVSPDEWTDTRSIADEATDEHNEAVARAAGARSYTRTDGQKITFNKPRVSPGWERMTRYRGKSGTYYQSQSDAAYAFDLEED